LNSHHPTANSQTPPPKFHKTSLEKLDEFQKVTGHSGKGE
jgi:hypothetical protein